MKNTTNRKYVVMNQLKSKKRKRRISDGFSSSESEPIDKSHSMSPSDEDYLEEDSDNDEVNERFVLKSRLNNSSNNSLLSGIRPATESSSSQKISSRQSSTNTPSSRTPTRLSTQNKSKNDKKVNNEINKESISTRMSIIGSVSSSSSSSSSPLSSKEEENESFENEDEDYDYEIETRKHGFAEEETGFNDRMRYPNNDDGSERDDDVVIMKGRFVFDEIIKQQNEINNNQSSKKHSRSLSSATTPKSASLKSYKTRHSLIKDIAKYELKFYGMWCFQTEMNKYCEAQESAMNAKRNWLILQDEGDKIKQKKIKKNFGDKIAFADGDAIIVIDKNYKKISNNDEEPSFYLTTSPWNHFYYSTMCSELGIPTVSQWKGGFSKCLNSKERLLNSVDPCRIDVGEKFELSIEPEQIQGIDALQYNPIIWKANGFGVNRYGTFKIEGQINIQTLEFYGKKSYDLDFEEKAFSNCENQIYAGTQIIQQNILRPQSDENKENQRNEDKMNIATNQNNNNNNVLITASSENAKNIKKQLDENTRYLPSRIKNDIVDEGKSNSAKVIDLTEDMQTRSSKEKEKMSTLPKKEQLKVKIPTKEKEKQEANPISITDNKKEEADDDNDDDNHLWKKLVNVDGPSKKEMCLKRIRHFVFSLERKHFLPYPQRDPNASQPGPEEWNPSYNDFHEYYNKHYKHRLKRSLHGKHVSSANNSTTSKRNYSYDRERDKSLNGFISSSARKSYTSIVTGNSSQAMHGNNNSNQTSVGSGLQFNTELSMWGTELPLPKKRRYSITNKAAMQKILFGGKLLNNVKIPPLIDNDDDKKSAKRKNNTNNQWQEAMLDKEDGHIYEGMIKNGDRHGFGILGYASGELYIGNFEENVENGFGSLYNQDGQLVYEGDFDNGKISGDGTFYYSNGDIYKGDIRDGGMRHGHGVYVQYNKGNNSNNKNNHSNADKNRGSDVLTSYEGDWHRNKRHGVGLFLSHGSYYEGEFQDDMRHGEGVLQLSNGFSFSGSFNKNLMNGIGKCEQEGVGSYEGHWKDGYREGRGTFKFPNGAIMEGRFARDNLIGGTMKMKSEEAIELNEDKYMIPIDLKRGIKFVHVLAGFTQDGT